MFKLEISGKLSSPARQSVQSYTPSSSFLPQDKVSEFAAMTPQQLLRETQRAAGDEHLEAWHQTLIEEGAELKKLLDVRLHLPALNWHQTSSQTINTEIEQLKQMRDRNEAIERDVQRYKERRKIEEEVVTVCSWLCVVSSRSPDQTFARLDSRAAVQRTPRPVL